MVSASRNSESPSSNSSPGREPVPEVTPGRIGERTYCPQPKKSPGPRVEVGSCFGFLLLGDGFGYIEIRVFLEYNQHDHV